ncbi:hypothetical protein VF14_18415 [Nostoc linckia z18]|uniref:DUF2635 domain-containing protein n=2 Tax=Nostoc linckia TaxID=92942 RepID=A0A9Q6EJX0_NOSLI|nr:DUF2635 domain-containing protein [Nostoc linckia]PHJ81961.1 hypothetical protein VF07_29115 [Nostoc linckia z6]PHJ92859.1 hypothetical protein VF04_27830 [Nostoc linckia z7]PHK00818.1 hypothetical protein VF08_23415 [Nostoc linckia z8]PHK09304.1 hypothetical protein VF09_15890 [Nostoc linckia z9]PHK33092.1 hypothetical protein VF14_18415 [Nostoc linckia z18]
MITRITIRPAEGLQFRDETGFPVPPEGKNVVLNTFWQRRLNEGAVVIVEDAPAPEKAKAVESDDTEQAGKRK